MKIELVRLSVTSLTHLEANELAKRFLADLAAVPAASTRIDLTVFNQYVQGLGTRSIALQKALLQTQGNAATQNIVALDAERDKSLRLLRKALKLALDSDVSTEAKAAHQLMVVLAKYNNMEDLNYEAETLALDKLIDEMQSTTYAPMVTTLLLTRYVQRLKTANDNFKTQFSSRLTTEAFKVSFDTRELRRDLLNYYRDFTLYVQVMANTTTENYYVQVMSIINTARKYYADMLATRRGKASAQKSDDKLTTPVSNN